MPKYQIDVPGQGTFEVESPTDLTDAQAYAAVQNQIRNTPTGRAPSSLKDTGIALAQGLVGAGKSLTDVAGADNIASEYLAGVQKGLGAAYSPKRQAEMARRAQLQEEASQSGSLYNEINTFLGGIAEAPVQSLAQALGSIAPYVGTGVVGGVAKLGAPTIRAINTVVGAAQGAGAVKGSIYDGVKDELVKSGMSESEAKSKASKAQEYLGENFLSIAGGSALGAAGARLGVEELMLPNAAAKLNAKLLPRVTTAALGEAPLEGIQGGQEQLATNLALQKQGIGVDTTKGVVGSAVRDAVLGAMAAGAVGLRGPGAQPATPIPTQEAPPAAEPASQVVPPTGVTPPQPTLPGAPVQTSFLEEGPTPPAPPTAEEADPELLGRLRQQYDVLEREIDRLAQQFEAEQDPAKKLAIKVQAQKYDFARREIAGQLQGAEPRPGTAPVEGQAELDFTQPYPKDRLPAEPTIIGQQKATPDQQAIELEFAKQRLQAGAPLTPAQQLLLRQEKAPEVATPQLELPTEVGAGARPTSFIVDDKAINTFGLSKAATKLRGELRGLDLMNEADRTKFEDAIAKHERKNAKIDMQAVEDFKAAIPQPVPAREVPEAAGLPAREFTPRQQYQQAREAMFAFGQQAAPISERDRAILAKQAYEAENGRTVSDVGTRTSEPSVQLPSGEQRTSAGTTAPTAPGLASPVTDVGRPAAGTRVQPSAKPGALGAFGQMAQQLAPEGKAKLKEEKTKRVKVEETTDELLKRLDAKLEGELQGKSTITLADRITQGDLRGALEEIATSKQFTQLDNLVAKRLLQAKTLPKVEIVSPEVTGGYPAQYDPNTDTVQITSGNVDSHTVLHETVHGFLHVMIQTSEAREAKGLGGNPKLKNLKDIYNHVKNKRPDLVNKYGMKNLSEFASEVMSNPDFQNDLRNTPYRKTNVFTEFGRAVLRLLGIVPEGISATDIDSLTAALVSTEQALSTGRKTQEDVQGGVRQQIEPEVARALGNDYEFDGRDTLGLTPDRIEAMMGEYAYTRPSESNKSKAYIAYVSPEDFLKATTPKDEVQRIEREATPLNERTIPMTGMMRLEFRDGKLVGHEGRHRMTALRNAGVKQVPMLFTYTSGEPRSAIKTFEVPPQRFYEDLHGQQGFTAHDLVPVNYDNYNFIKEKFSARENQIAYLERTPQGQQAEQLMSAFGGKAEAGKPSSYIQQKKDSFNKAKDAWEASYEQNQSRVAATFGKGQNIASFDQAFSNRLYNHFMDLVKKGDKTLEQAKQALIRISISQALHRGNLANQIIDKGNYDYDSATNRWTAVEDEVNMKAFEGLIRSLADKLGVEPNRARQIMGAAYEANRLNGMYAELNKTTADLAQAEAALKTIKDPKQRATKKALIQALEDKQQELSGKVQHKTPEQVAAGMELYNAYPEIKQGTDVWNTMRERVVNLLVDTGVKTQEQAEKWLDEAAYVPFFRDIGEEKAAGPQVMARGIRESMQDHRMKGSQLEVNDPIENMYQWMQWSIARGISNKQLQVMLDQYKAVLPDEVGEGKGPNTFTIYRDGVKRDYHVADPAIAQAFTGMEPIVFPGIGAAVAVTNNLRHLITRNPLFSAAQLFSDSYTAMFTSGLKHPFALLKEIAKEVSATARGESTTREALKAAGILETHDYSAMNEADALGQRLNLNEPSKWRKTMSMLDRLSSASDNVIRQGVYNQAIKEGLSHAEAMEKAAEIVNFRRISGDPRVQFLSRIVPFFNAYMQVTSVAVKTLTGRGISPQERLAAEKVLLATTAKVAVLSMLYSMAIGDDEDYLKKNRVSRDRMWMIPGTGGMGIPVRSDVFALPKVVSEYTYQMMSDKGTTDSKMFKDAMKRAVISLITPPSEGIPQIVRPVIEIATNHDFFQDREIVNATMRRLDADKQYNKNTTELAKAFGSMTGMSPLMIDHFLRGYFGSAVTLGALATNDAINAARGGAPRPEMTVGQMLSSLPNMSGFMSKEENTAVLSDFYEVARDVNKAAATFSSMKYAPREERQAYAQEHAKELRYKNSVQALSNQLLKLKQHEQAVREMPESRMSAERKQAELKRIDEARSKMSANIAKIRQAIYE